jgi:segregation and condensation protein B
MTQASSPEVGKALEAILFLADEPLSASLLAQTVECGRREVEDTLRELSRSYQERGAGIALVEVAGGFRLMTHPEAAPFVERFVLSARHTRLTRASLETLAIVAYKQPVTRHQISSIRGVDSDGVIRALADRGLVEEVGREEGPGRPVLYGTSTLFLERLGLPSLSDLPPIVPLLDDAGSPEAPVPAD